MPLGEQERIAVERRALDLIRIRIDHDFLVYYAAIIGTFEQKPFQLHNQISNAVTHIARALNADDLPSAESELGKADVHIERAIRDALKIFIARMRERITHLVMRIEGHHGILHRPFQVSIREIEKERTALYKDETQGKHAIGPRFQTIANSLVVLEDQMREHYVLYSEVRYKFGTFLRASWGVLSIISVGILGSLIASVLFALAFPNALDVKPFVMKLFGIENVHNSPAKE